MILKVRRSPTRGVVRIPGSKSHTIRALLIASLAEGESTLIDPLISDDAISAVNVCSALGAQIHKEENSYKVKGFGGVPKTPDNVIDVGNSGTSLRLALGTAAFCQGTTVFTGDHQIRRRPLGPLIASLNDLGANVYSTRDNGLAPVVVRGTVQGGVTSLDAVTSQYLSSLLINLPMAQKNTQIDINRLNEVPYVEMTLWWLDKQKIEYQNNEFKSFHIIGNQRYKPFEIAIPGDFSSATFFMVLAAISGGEFTLNNLDMTDPQGDKAVVAMLTQMGAKITCGVDSVTIKSSGLRGCEFDMNATPDALPAMAVAGCFAEGETKLLNVPQARLKETDRIMVMCQELTKLGADITELEDGLIIKQSKLRGAAVNGHYDHRVIMALGIAGLCIEGDTTIDTAEAINVTFPDFVKFLQKCGGDIELEHEENMK